MASSTKKTYPKSSAQPRPQRQQPPAWQKWLQKLADRFAKRQRSLRRTKRTISKVLNPEPTVQKFAEETDHFVVSFKPFGVVADELKQSTVFAVAASRLEFVLSLCADFRAAFADQGVTLDFALTLQEAEDHTSIALLVQPDTKDVDIYGLFFDLADRYSQQISRIKPDFTVLADYSKRKVSTVA